MVPPRKKKNKNGYYYFKHILKGYPSSSNQRSSSFLLVLASVNLPQWYLSWHPGTSADTRQGKKKAPSVLKTKLCKLEKMTSQLQRHVSVSGLFDLPCQHIHMQSGTSRPQGLYPRVALLG